MRVKGKRATSAELLGVMAAQGIQIEGKSPINSFSSMLSYRKEIFDNVRGEGYGLVEWSQENAPLAETSGAQ